MMVAKLRRYLTWERVLAIAGLIDAIAVPICMGWAFYYFVAADDAQSAIFCAVLAIWFGRGQR